MTDPSLRVLTVGAGAVGCFYAAQLARAGCQVSLLCRSDYEVVARQGVRIHQQGTSYQFMPIQVIRQAATCEGSPDILLIALKALPAIPMVELIAPAVGPRTTLLLLQNGIGQEEILQQAFPRHEILGGLAFTCLNRVAAGEIVHLDYGRLVIGRFPDGPSATATTLARLFESVGIPCRVTEEVIRERWRKLVWNAPFNPISVLGRADTRQIMELPATARLAQRVMEEVVRIAAAEGFPLDAEVVSKNLRDTRAMAPYRTSMLMDWLANRPLEVEAILGEPLARAQRHGLAAPAMESLYGLLKLLEQPAAPATCLTA